MVANLEKSLYKTLLLTLKVIPIILAFVNLLNTILWFYNINYPILSYIAGVSLLPMIFLYISSIVFKFCRYHRMFLHYTMANMLLNIFDYKYCLSIDLIYYFIVFGVFLILSIYFYIKEKRDVKRTEKCLT